MSVAETGISHAEEARREGIPDDVFRRRWLILVTLCVSLFTVMIANSSINLALPALSRELELTQLELTWVVEAYSLVFAALLFLASAIADHYGRRRVMQLGLAIFMVASVYAGVFAGSGVDLIAARTFMGLGAALVMPTTLSIVNVVFPSSERRRAIAIWAGIAGTGMIFGNILSGVILEFLSWEWMFLSGGLFALISFAMNQSIVPESRDETGAPVDWVGGALVTGGLVGVVYAIMEAPTYGLGDGLILAGLIAGLIALAAFVWWELRTEDPMLDVRIFRSPQVGLSALAITLIFFAMLGAFFGLSQMLQLVMGYGVLLSSVALLPAMLPMTLVSPFVPKVVDRMGTKWTVAPGLGLVAMGLLLMSMWPAEPAYWQVIGGMLIMTTGMAFAMTPATNMMMAAVPKNRSGMGSALNDTTRELGAAMGVAVLGSMLSSGYTSNIADAVVGLPGQAAEFASSSIGGAIEVAAQLGDAGQGLILAANEAFMTGYASAMVVSAVVALGAALLIAIGLPNREVEAEPEPDEEPVVEALI